MKVRWFILILGVAVALGAGSCGAVPDQVAEQTPGLPPRTIIVRVYYDDRATRHAIVISFEHALMETNYAEGYHILKATDEDIARLLAAGLRVEEDPAWTGPGSFSEIPPEEATPTPTSAG